MKEALLKLLHDRSIAEKRAQAILTTAAAGKVTKEQQTELDRILERQLPQLEKEIDEAFENMRAMAAQSTPLY